MYLRDDVNLSGGEDRPVEVLLVDDEENIRELLREFLVDEGFRVRTSSTGEDGLWAMQERPAEILLTDLRMPGISGLELLRRVRESWPGTEVVLITGFASVEDAVEALRQGASDFLLKPVRLQDLEAVTKRCAERVRAARDNRELRAVVQKLRELNERKEKFIALANHELRTPTTVACGLASILASRTESLPENARELVQRVDLALRRLRDIVEDLGDLALTQGGRLELRKVREPIERLMDDARNSLHLYQGLRALTLELRAEADPKSEVVVDRRKLRRALNALIQNAVKFTPDGGAVWVRIARDDDFLTLQVEDTGVGISSGEAAKIFDLFYEIADTRHHRSSFYEFGGGGLGVGLPLAAAIAQAHGGTLEHRPRPEGGSIFTLKLPLNAP
ncbi:MAG: response regulator [Deltaproteobacteria bacterium]|nr:response regulator [Deltaproteobacteria bacterium]